MSEELREQIRNNFNLKDIYELLEIWKTNNRIEWSDTAFEVLREMLRERMREIPLQDKPIFEPEEVIQDNNGLEAWEDKLLNNEDQPELYNPAEVITFRRNINRLVIAAAVIYHVTGPLIANCFYLFPVQSTNIHPENPDGNGIQQSKSKVSGELHASRAA